MRVAEERLEALALNDERIERGEDVYSIRAIAGQLFESCRSRPVRLGYTFDLDRDELLAPDPGFDQAAHRGFGRRIQVAGRMQTHHGLSRECPVQNVPGRLSLGGSSRKAWPTEVTGGQLVGFQHAGALADRQHALVERQ